MWIRSEQNFFISFWKHSQYFSTLNHQQQLIPKQKLQVKFLKLCLAIAQHLTVYCNFFNFFFFFNQIWGIPKSIGKHLCRWWKFALDSSLRPLLVVCDLMLENQSQQSSVHFCTSSYALPVPESKSKVHSSSPHMNNESQVHLKTFEARRGRRASWHESQQKTSKFFRKSHLAHTAQFQEPKVFTKGIISGISCSSQ